MDADRGGALMAAAATAVAEPETRPAVARALDPDAPFYVAGHAGLAGSAIWRRLRAEGFGRLLGERSRDLDLTDRGAVFRWFERARPRYVVLAAGKVGGILANALRPVEFLSLNVRIQVNVLDAALEHGVERLLLLTSSSIYPSRAQQPLREDSLLSGALEPAEDAYAIAKITGLLHVQAVRREYGLPWIAATTANLYGPGDRFSPSDAHVLPALIRRYDEAAWIGATEVTNWGSGTPRREFLHADDLADAALFLLEHYDGTRQVNVGTGRDLPVRELAAMVAEETGFTGQTYWDRAKPDGAPQRLLDVSTLSGMGWRPRIELRDGIRSTIEWYRAHRADLRA